jgi:hypothetical protein
MYGAVVQPHPPDDADVGVSPGAPSLPGVEPSVPGGWRTPPSNVGFPASAPASEGGGVPEPVRVTTP